MLNLLRIGCEDNIKVVSKEMAPRWGRVQWQDIIVACIPVARQQPRNKQLHNSLC
jgi:hypothetical protein